MQRWEYKIITVDHAGGEVMETLERLGNEGWELVSTLPAPAVAEQAPGGAPQMVFKRLAPPLNTYELIREAILNKQQVVATYRGHRRAMCPHVLGIKGFIRHALFYQFGGTSEHWLPPSGEWRCMDIDHLLDLTVREGQWHTRDDYDQQRQSCVDTIDLSVDLAPH